MEPLTDKQQAILDFIDHEQARSGIMPSTREIQEHFGFASQTVLCPRLTSFRLAFSPRSFFADGVKVIPALKWTTKALDRTTLRGTLN